MVKKINYTYINNNKRTIVLMHGWGLDKSSFDGLVHFFCKDFSVLTLDFMGFGDSDKVEDYYDTYEFAYQIFLLLKQLGIEDMVMVGHSFGGRVAIILSSLFNIKIVGVVLTSSAGLTRFSLWKFLKVFRYKILKKMSQWGLVDKDKLTGCGSDDYKKLDRDMRKVFVRVVNQDLRYLLNRISVRTVLVWDKKDKDTPYWICKKMHKGIKNSGVVLFDRGGHFACFYNLSKFANICIKYVLCDTN